MITCKATAITHSAAIAGAKAAAEASMARPTSNGATAAPSDEAAAWLARVGYDPTYGARPLKRVILAQLVLALATTAALPMVAELLSTAALAQFAADVRSGVVSTSRG